MICLHPGATAFNDGISQELSSLKYAKVDDAVARILQLGKGTQMVKLDLKNAYRIVPIHPHDQHLLALRWEGQTYVDRSLPFGLRSAPKIFSAIADMIAWALYRAGVKWQIHYLDDFLLLEAPDLDNGARALTTATETLQWLGVPVANNKTEGPATLVVFLGIVIDTRSFELRLPLEKVQRLQALLQEWSHKKACTRKELESLVGHLSHAATMILPGRTFLHQFFDLLPSSQRSQPVHPATYSCSLWRHCWAGRYCRQPLQPLLSLSTAPQVTKLLAILSSWGEWAL